MKLSKGPYRWIGWQIDPDIELKQCISGPFPTATESGVYLRFWMIEQMIMKNWDMA